MKSKEPLLWRRVSESSEDTNEKRRTRIVYTLCGILEGIWYNWMSSSSLSISQVWITSFVSAILTIIFVRDSSRHLPAHVWPQILSHAALHTLSLISFSAPLSILSPSRMAMFVCFGDLWSSFVVESPQHFLTYLKVFTFKTNKKTKETKTKKQKQRSRKRNK